MSIGEETQMGASVPPAQAGLGGGMEDNGNTQYRQSGAGSRGTVIGGDASAKSSAAQAGGGSGGGGGGGSGGGGGGGGGGMGPISASIAGTQTTASGQSGDMRSGSSGIRSQGGVTFGTVQFAGGDAENTTGIPGWVLAVAGVVVAVVGLVAWLLLRKKG